MARVVSRLGELVIADRLLPRFRTVPDHLQWAWLIAATHRGRIKGLLLGYPATWPQLPTSDQVAKQEEPIRPCTCRYGLHRTIWHPTHLIDVPGIGQRGAAYTFRIDPACPHHGTDVRVITDVRLLWISVDREGLHPAWTVLDDQERRGD